MHVTCLPQQHIFLPRITNRASRHNRIGRKSMLPILTKSHFSAPSQNIEISPLKCTDPSLPTPTFLNHTGFNKEMNSIPFSLTDLSAYSSIFINYWMLGNEVKKKINGSRFPRRPSLLAVLSCNCQSLTSSGSCRLAWAPHGGT